ncbi:MAG: ABC transporter ATP-binding protein [Actinomycetes bacterium]
MTYAVDSLTVRFGPTVALDDVSLSMPGGAVVAVVGGDGAGKSTLLRAVVGEIPLKHGTITAPNPEQIGYLPATTGSWLDLSVQQNMEFVGGVYGLTGADLATRCDGLLARAELTEARNRLSRQLSGGMRRKLGFCLAMIHDPPLLVLDEPSTGVDPVSRVDLWRLISEAAAGGAAVLMSTTYLDEAERAAYLLVLDAGRAIVSDTPENAITSLTGTVTSTAVPTRREWAWRRGRMFHEYWPPDDPATPPGPITPDLEDVVIAMSLQHRASLAARP